MLSSFRQHPCRWSYLAVCQCCVPSSCSPITIQSNQRALCSFKPRVASQQNSRILDVCEPLLTFRRSVHRSSCLPRPDERNKGEERVTLNPSEKSPKEKQRIDLSLSYTANIFITPLRAMREYLLTSKDLEHLWKTTRRSPYENSPPITVYMRYEVEQLAVKKYGSVQELKIRQNKLRDSSPTRRGHDFGNKPTEEDLRLGVMYGKTARSPSDIKLEREQKTIFKSGSGRVVLYAIAINGANAVLKFGAWLSTGSHSMFSEAIHSVADTVNQIILAYGLHHSFKNPDPNHPYGYTNFRYVASLISGVGVFCVGAGLSWYHGIMGILHPHSIESMYWALCILGGSLVSECATLFMAIAQIRKKAKLHKCTFSEYVYLNYDPNVNVILLEDMAAVTGVAVAGGCMSLSYYLSNPLPDAIGSLLIGGLLAGVSSFIIYTNTNALVGRSIPRDDVQEIAMILEYDRMIRSVYDIKATDMGGHLVKFKAEVDIDGKELTRLYLEQVNLQALLKEMQEMRNVEAVEMFLLKHGESIVEKLGGQIDRIEKKMKKKHPELRHVDLEVL